MQTGNIRFIQSLMGIIIGGLIGWCFYEFGNPQSELTLMGWTTGILSSVFLGVGLGIGHASRAFVSMRLWALISFFIMLIVNIIFACFDFNVPLFISVNTIILILWLNITLSIYTRRH